MNNQKYHLSVLATFLELNYDLTIDELIEKVKNQQIALTSSEIEAYLKERAEEENPELCKRINRAKNKENKSKILGTEEYMQNFSDRLEYARYEFEPFTLTYYETYIKIVKNKALMLLNLIKHISENNLTPIEEDLIKYDIEIKNISFKDELDSYAISSEEIKRLIDPTIYNINTLFEKAEEANTLETYLIKKISLEGLYRRGVSEVELYPSKELQTDHLEMDLEKGNIKLSEKQADSIKREEEAYIEGLAKILKKL